MIKTPHFILITIALCSSLQACTQQPAEQKSNAESAEKRTLTLSDNFGEHWYQGKAELSSYTLEQVRYGERRKGDAVLIFVTEDFSESKQVKLDNPQANPSDAQKVLKLNFTKKFNTGIYPYSIMSSIFSPVYPKNDIHAVKISTSVQEWCGHVFMQFNKESDNYKGLIRSYFESEGDQTFNLPLSWSEDELWNMIRLDPQSLPTGELKIIPSTMYLRLKHKEAAAYKAKVKKDIQGDNTTLIINYPELNRVLKINYNTNFPHQIESWEETYPENGQDMTTTATLKERIMLDYWNRNGVKDSTYRAALGLK